jgi:hypothetical protein
MKKIILLLLMLNVHFIYSQTPCDNYCLNFEDTLCLSTIVIDTATVQNNLWQIGRSYKPYFDSAQSPKNVIITDSINPYPVNNHSVFISRNMATMGDVYGFRMFTGAFNVQTDSLHDYGMMEFSPDNGATWVDMINDTVYNVFVWYSQKPILTGKSPGWKYFDVLLADIGSVFNIQMGDTLLFRFTFVSDNIAENLGGLMYDDFCFFDFVEGISEVQFKPIKSKIYPNPSIRNFMIEFENPLNKIFELAVYDIHSKLILKKENIPDNKIGIDTNSFKSGTYIYKITNLKAQKRCWGKFIVAE